MLDTGPAGMIAHPHANPDLTQWVLAVLAAGDIVVLPEIVDYELRRSFLLEIARGHATFRRSLQRLNQLRATLAFLPLSSDAMLKAADLWAQARRIGKPTADLKELDGDVILAAQTFQVNGAVVTDNPGHLGIFVPTLNWREP